MDGMWDGSLGGWEVREGHFGMGTGSKRKGREVGIRVAHRRADLERGEEGES